MTVAVLCSVTNMELSSVCAGGYSTVRYMLGYASSANFDEEIVMTSRETNTPYLDSSLPIPRASPTYSAA